MYSPDPKPVGIKLEGADLLAYTNRFYQKKREYYNGATKRHLGTALLVFSTLGLTAAWLAASIYVGATFNANKLIVTVSTVSAVCGTVMGIVLATLGGIRHDQKAHDDWHHLKHLNLEISNEFINKRNHPSLHHSPVNEGDK